MNFEAIKQELKKLPEGATGFIALDESLVLGGPGDFSTIAPGNCAGLFRVKSSEEFTWPEVVAAGPFSGKRYFTLTGERLAVYAIRRESPRNDVSFLPEYVSAAILT